MPFIYHRGLKWGTIAQVANSSSLILTRPHPNPNLWLFAIFISSIVRITLCSWRFITQYHSCDMSQFVGQLLFQMPRDEIRDVLSNPDFFPLCFLDVLWKLECRFNPSMMERTRILNSKIYFPLVKLCFAC